MKGHWRAGCAGCLILILLCSLALGDCTLRFFQSMQREPELPIQQLLHRELEAFPSGWTLGKSDMTSLQKLTAETPRAQSSTSV